MKQILIGGVSSKEKTYLDKIWSFKSHDQFQDWVATLTNENQELAHRMLKMILFEMEFLEFDEKVNMSDFEESKIVLEKFLRK